LDLARLPFSFVSLSSSESCSGDLFCFWDYLSGYAWSQVGHGADKTIGNWIGSKESFSPLLVPSEWSFWTGAA